MALKDAPIIEDPLTGHAVIFESQKKEADALAFSEALLILQARIINAAQPEKQKFGHSAIYMDKDGSCIAVPILPTATQLEEVSGKRPIAIVKWISPIAPQTPASLNIYTRLSEGAQNVTHRMLIADTSEQTSLIVSSVALDADAQDRLLFAGVVTQLAPTNQIASEAASL